MNYHIDIYGIKWYKLPEFKQTFTKWLNDKNPQGVWVSNKRKSDLFVNQKGELIQIMK